MLLSRAANALYWMSRYIERAENIVRFIQVNEQLSLDRDRAGEAQWMPLVAVTGDDTLFFDRYGEVTKHNVLRFLTLDRDYANSVAACIAAARENARTVRHAITAEMWQQINHLHLMVQRVVDRGFSDEELGRFAQDVKNDSLLFAGIADATLSRGMVWDFCQLGQMNERADKTSRILDVKYFILLPKPEDVGGAIDSVQWAALLRSVGGLEMYRRHEGAIGPASVAGFLVLDEQFPRSLIHCLSRSESALQRIIGEDPAPSHQDVLRRLGRLRAELEFADIGEIIAGGLHDYLDQFQQRLNEVDEVMNGSLFQLMAPDEAGATDTSNDAPPKRSTPSALEAPQQQEQAQ